MYLPDKTGIERKIHSILTYQTESKRMGCINRDENAVNNMIKIINTYVLNKTRPERFQISRKIKDDNPYGCNYIFFYFKMGHFPVKKV
jgi:hypothetical protein